MEAAGGRPGTFVELGAYDGITGSQSYLLEHCYGWHGVLIEASPRNYARLVNTSRSRQTAKVHSAVCNDSGVVEITGRKPYSASSAVRNVSNSPKVSVVLPRGSQLCAYSKSTAGGSAPARTSTD